jgi:hypothetical protein
MAVKTKPPAGSAGAAIVASNRPRSLATTSNRPLAGEFQKLCERIVEVDDLIEVIVHSAKTGAGPPLDKHGEYQALVREHDEISAKMIAHMNAR